MATITKKDLLEALDIGNAQCKDIEWTKEDEIKSRLIKRTHDRVKDLLCFAGNEYTIEGDIFERLKNMVDKSATAKSDAKAATDCARVEFLLSQNKDELDEILIGIEENVCNMAYNDKPKAVEYHYTRPIFRRQKWVLYSFLILLGISAVATIAVTIAHFCGIEQLDNVPAIIGALDLCLTVVAFTWERIDDMKKKKVVKDLAKAQAEDDANIRKELIKKVYKKDDAYINISIRLFSFNVFNNNTINLSGDKNDD